MCFMSVLLMPNCTSYLHNADCFSRLPIGNDPTFERYRSQNSVVNVVQESWLTSLPISAEEVRKATEEDHVLQKVIEQIKNGWPKMRKKVSSFVLFFISVRINTLHLRCSVWADRVGQGGLTQAVPASYDELNHMQQHPIRGRYQLTCSTTQHGWAGETYYYDLIMWGAVTQARWAHPNAVT